MSYQSFDDKEGASDSNGKLAALKLPGLKGKSFLDLGCNAGFFCGEALRQGARRVVGIDSSLSFISAAKKKFPKAEFLNQSWDKLPDEKFDVIIMLSALHYEMNPKKLLREIYNRLSPDGVFIYEGGIGNSEHQVWIEVPRSVGVVKYPSWPLFRDCLFEDFAVRRIGRSVNQAGDPLPRYVVHCSRKKPNIILITGDSGQGKTNIGFMLKSYGVVTLHTDKLLFEQARSEIKLKNETLNKYFLKFQANNIGSWVNNIKSDELSSGVIDFVLNSIPIENNLIVLEGYLFTNEIILSKFLEKCNTFGIRIWLCNNVCD